jgi:hypothetical protein
MAGVGGTQHVLRDTLKKRPSVRESRERIVIHEAIKPLLPVEMIDGERNIAGQLGY